MVNEQTPEILELQQTAQLVKTKLQEIAVYLRVEDADNLLSGIYQAIDGATLLHQDTVTADHIAQAYVNVFRMVAMGMTILEMVANSK